MSDDRLLRNSYRFFSADHDVGDAVRAFRARYGVLPTEKPFSDGRYLYVGPVPSAALPENAERRGRAVTASLLDE